jgi:hypothetical protein
MTLPRTRLLTRLSASEPRLVRLLAPPGYAKSSLARLFARRFDRHSICDCVGTADGIDFAGRAMSALAAESQNGGESVALARLHLHATQADAASWSRALLNAWKGRQEHALFILEHAEAIAENSSVLALVGDLLAARPSERVVLISSRVPLPLRIGHYLAPHQILTLSQHELRFNADEATALFDGTELATELVARIVKRADGWPIVLLLLARFAQYDSAIEKLIDRLEEIPAPRLHEYLSGEVLSEFTPEMMSTILATAAIPAASLEDIAAATGIRHATPIIDRLLNLPGFISSDTGAYQAHPLLLGAIRAHHGAEETNYLIRAAQAYDAAGDFVRAAELYLAYGDEASAAAALERLPARLLERPASRLIDVLARIKLPMLCAHPNLWIALLPYRRQHVEAARLYGEAARLMHSLPAVVSPALQRRLRVRLAHLAQELEQLAEAESLLEASQTNDDGEIEPEERRLLLMTKAIVAAKRGRLAEADQLLDESDAVQGARHLRFDAESGQITMEKARILGDLHGVLKMSEEALYAASRSGVTSRIVEAGRAVAAAAWYCNDDARLTSARQLLEDCGDGDVRAFARCVETALARAPIDAPARTLQTARWHAALTTNDADLAKDLFDAAIEGIDGVENGFLRIAIRVCAALLLPAQRRRLLEARVIAARIESPPLQASLELLIDSPEPASYGIFKEMAERVARSPLKVHREVFYLDVLRGRARRGSDPLPVSDRGLELLAALALLPAGTSKEELAAAIWPGLHGDDALNSLKMCVSRTRAQAGDKDVIQSTKGGYALNERVTIDVREFESLLRGARGNQSPSDAVCRQIRDAVAAIEVRNRAQTANWTWFAPHADHLDELRNELTAILAKGLRRSFDFDLVVAAHPVDENSERAEVVGRPT